MKKIVLTITILLTSISAFAWHGCHRGGWGHHHGWHHGGGWYHHRYYHGGGYWGRGGCNFWPGFVGGVVGGVVGTAITRPYYTDTVVVQQPTVVTTPTVVQQPVVVQQPAPVIVQQPAPVVVQQPTQVWVEGRYVDQVQANGSTIRVWQPGHYEYR